MDFLRKAEDVFHEVKEAIHHHDEEERPQADQAEQSHADNSENAQPQTNTSNYRFQSFAPETSGSVKWYVDGASYFHAVSLALEGIVYMKLEINWFLFTKKWYTG